MEVKQATDYFPYYLHDYRPQHTLFGKNLPVELSNWVEDLSPISVTLVKDPFPSG